MYRRTVGLLMGAGLLLCGCGEESAGPVIVPVNGLVLMNGEPLEGAEVTFIPLAETAGMGGTGRTDADGYFELDYARGGKGAAEGEYRVVISRRVMPDGSVVPRNDPTPPIESPASETLPAKYSNVDHSQLKAKVDSIGEPIAFNLKVSDS